VDKDSADTERTMKGENVKRIRLPHPRAVGKVSSSTTGDGV